MDEAIAEIHALSQRFAARRAKIDRDEASATLAWLGSRNRSTWRRAAGWANGGLGERRAGRAAGWASGGLGERRAGRATGWASRGPGRAAGWASRGLAVAGWASGGSGGGGLGERCR